MENEHDDLVNEVLKKIGVNILLFQQIENSLKLLLPFICDPNSAKTPALIAKNTEKLKSQTLGNLISKFTESIDCDIDYFFDHLKKLTSERNKLVHNFGDLDGLNILNTEDGCRACIASLETQRQEAYDFYGVVQLIGFGLISIFYENCGESNLEIASLYNNLKSSLLTEQVEYVNLSNPSETLWENTKIVKLLRLAELNIDKVNAMTSLAKAGEFIKKQDPECTPKSYGIKTLKGILKVSTLFEVIEDKDINQNIVNVLYRSRASAVLPCIEAHRAEVETQLKLTLEKSNDSGSIMNNKTAS